MHGSDKLTKNGLVECVSLSGKTEECWPLDFGSRGWHYSEGNQQVRARLSCIRAMSSGSNCLSRVMRKQDRDRAPGTLL